MKVKVATHHYPEGLEMEAIKTACPSLVLTHTITVVETAGFADSEPEITTNKTWTITHVPTGYAILTGIRNKKQALSACKVWAVIQGWETLTHDNKISFAEANKDLLSEGKRLITSWSKDAV